MTGPEVRTARKLRGWTQAQLATTLGVSQGYLSLVESNRRPVSMELARKLAGALPVAPTSVPMTTTAPLPSEHARHVLGGLGYEGFRYLAKRRRMNPAEALLRTLRSTDLDARVTRALPWLVVEYAHLDWEWLVRHAKQEDLQNRLGFVVSLGRALAKLKGNTRAEAALARLERSLEPSRLARTDSLGALTQAEERWLRKHSSAEARQWNVLSSLTPEVVADAT